MGLWELRNRRLRCWPRSLCNCIGVVSGEWHAFKWFIVGDSYTGMTIWVAMTGVFFGIAGFVNWSVLLSSCSRHF